VAEQDHPIFNDDAEQLAMLIGVLDAFPGHRDGVLVPIHPKARGPWAEALLKRGVRVHPELMEELPVAGDHPEAAWMNPPRWVKREKYVEEQDAAASTPEQQMAVMQQLLQALKPDLAKQIESMTPEQREQARQEQAAQFPVYLAQLQELGAQFIQTQQQRATAAPEEES